MQTNYVADGQTYPIDAAVILPNGKRQDFPKGGYRVTFPSLESFYNEAMRAREAGAAGSDYSGDTWASLGHTRAQLGDMVRDGWTDKAAEVQEISDRALTVADTLADEIRPMLRFDVQGEECDMGRYYGGEPECMLDWPLTPVPGEGRVITLISGMCFSGAVSTDTIVKRGLAVAGLAEALTRLGYSVAIVLDISSGHRTGGGSVQVTVKGATDDLHMPRVIFGLAHPSILRVFGFEIWESSSVRGSVMNSGLGPCNDPQIDKADGQIMVPGVELGGRFWDNPESFIREQFVKLGLIDATE